MKPIRTLRSHTAHAGYLASCEEEAMGIVKPKEIPSPYRYSPTWTVFVHPVDGSVFIVETEHRVFRVFSADGIPRVPFEVFE